MGKVLNHLIEIFLPEGLETAGAGVGFRQPDHDLALLGGYQVIIWHLRLVLQKFVAMVVEPARESPAFVRRQGPNGGFHLLDTHAGKLTSFPSNWRSK